MYNADLSLIYPLPNLKKGTVKTFHKQTIKASPPYILLNLIERLRLLDIIITRADHLNEQGTKGSYQETIIC
mgnify:CR=1 FL=1